MDTTKSTTSCFFLSFCFLHEYRVDFSVDRTMFFSKFFSCLQKCRKKHGTVSDDNDDDKDTIDAVDSSSNLLFELHTLQLATNFFSELNQLGRGGFGPVFKSVYHPFGSHHGSRISFYGCARRIPDFALLKGGVKFCLVLTPSGSEVFRSTLKYVTPRPEVRLGACEPSRFCPMYKASRWVEKCETGLMPNGEEVAIKKLSMESRQGIREFMNEVRLLLRIQHKNLVTLLDKKRSLDWTTRFKIITGVARGLLYLHEEAPERIIHRDIKASNILLDEKLNPKISDFGLARLFPGEDTHVQTFRISGTHGYMAPEYAMRGYLSVKTDVFSYGVLVLEIVSGRKNHDVKLGSEKADLLSYAWKLYQGGKIMDLIDQSVGKYNGDEAAMCIQLGLLCCQASIVERPDMNSVHLMLSSDSFTLPRPSKPGIQGRVGKWNTTSTSALTNTNASSATKASGGSSFVEDYSRNSISTSSFDEGR
ncbi:G-type lectin S-receptor-like serine/threonine-protein kinase [Trifolium pratense]|uniref:G-type lectin S-receptor-like serine/threonine-protein kinase n=1 Tax=Trifolium pratense TaxID=57577 RepID=A0A2K3MX38_TRIPR|nr:G-type lectin S-receptor-like serine/threonine-protein kinase [Trifolium pratense]